VDSSGHPDRSQVLEILSQSFEKRTTSPHWLTHTIESSILVGSTPDCPRKLAICGGGDRRLHNVSKTGLLLAVLEETDRVVTGPG
jgi:hypothetical protein